MSRPPLKKLVAAGLTCGALVLAGCGSGTSSSNASSASSGAGASGSSSLLDKLPAKIKSAGKIVIGSSIDYPPFEYYAADGKTLQGFEPDLAALLEKKLGVTFDWQTASFDTLFTALRSGRYDIVYGATNDTAEREKLFDFVDYLKSSQGFVVAKGNPQGIKTVDDLCGKAIAVVRGGVQQQFLEGQSSKCTGSGKGAVNVLAFDGNSGEQLAVKQGQAAAMLENYPTAVTFAKASNGTLELVPNLQVSQTFFGMVVPKDQTQLRDALQQAWQAIVDDGSYKKVLDKWGLGDIGVASVKINQAQGR